MVISSRGPVHPVSPADQQEGQRRMMKTEECCQAKVEQVVRVAAIARFVTRGACNGNGALPIIEQSRTRELKSTKPEARGGHLPLGISIHPLGAHLKAGPSSCAFPLLLLARGFIANRPSSASSTAMAMAVDIIDAGKTTHQSRSRTQLPPSRLPNDDSAG